MNLSINALAGSPSSRILGRDEMLRAAQGDAAAIASISVALRKSGGARLSGVPELAPNVAARLVLQLKPRDAQRLLSLLPDTQTLAILNALDPSVRARLFNDSENASLGRIVGSLDAVAAADLVKGLPAEVVDAALAGRSDAEAIRAAIAYGEETAGGAMLRRQLVAIPVDWTVARVIDQIRANSDHVERLYAVYVVDEQKHLIGYLKLRDLLMQPTDARVRDIMRSDVTAVMAGSDREELTRVAARERLPAVPVIDDKGRLVGIVGADELRQIDRSEASEDIKLLSSVSLDSGPADTPFLILRRRFPWLASALIGALGAGLIVGSFEEELEEAVILAALIPLVMDMAGNAGIQSSAVTIEAMASPQFWRGDVRARFLREIGGALLNGAAIGLLTALGIMTLAWVFPIDAPGWLATTAAATLLLIVVQAAMVGVLVPLVLRRMKCDPAVGTGVFITTVNDFSGITVLFLVAKLLYLPHV